MPLLRGLVASIRQASAIACTVLDLGLTDADTNWLADQGVTVIAAENDFPDMVGPNAPRWFRAMTARPFLPRYLPGFDRYIWIDADAWVQDWPSLESRLAAVPAGCIGLVQERWRRALDFTIVVNGVAYPIKGDHAYLLEQHRLYWEAAFGREIAQAQRGALMFNIGVFTLTRDSALWARWAGHLAQALDAVRVDINSGAPAQASWTVEQAAINRALLDAPELRVALPDRYNWCLHLGLPDWRAGSGYIDPDTGDRIAVLHLVGLKRFPRLPIVDRDTGAVAAMSVRFED